MKLQGCTDTYNKHYWMSVFVISGIIKVEVSVIPGRGKCYQPSRSPRLITLNY